MTRSKLSYSHCYILTCGNTCRIDHCVAGCMTRYLPWEKLSPAEAEEVPRAKPEVLPRLPREIIFPKVDNRSYTPLRSGLSIAFFLPVNRSCGIAR